LAGSDRPVFYYHDKEFRSGPDRPVLRHTLEPRQVALRQPRLPTSRPATCLGAAGSTTRPTSTGGQRPTLMSPARGTSCPDIRRRSRPSRPEQPRQDPARDGKRTAHVELLRPLRPRLDRHAPREILSPPLSTGSTRLQPSASPVSSNYDRPFPASNLNPATALAFCSALRPPLLSVRGGRSA